jgi:small subunit ribosomal protein S2
MSNNITMRQMLEAGVHFGHRKRDWNPKMSEFIYGIHYQVHIINLEITLPLFREALNYVSRVASKKGKILFVGTKQAAREIIKEQALRCGMPYVNDRWLGGMLTNYKTIRQSIKRLKDLESTFESGGYEGLTKKEKLHLYREKEKLERSLGGIKDMGSLPDVLFVIDVGHEKIAIDEAVKLGIPVIGVVDTNNSPDRIDHVIPGNDDSFRAIQLYTQMVADTILEARSQHVEEIDKEEGEVPKVKVDDKGKRKVVTKKPVGSNKEKEEGEEQETSTSANQTKRKTTSSKAGPKAGAKNASEEAKTTSDNPVNPSSTVKSAVEE